jgi:transcription antitermination factor NusG
VLCLLGRHPKKSDFGSIRRSLTTKSGPGLEVDTQTDLFEAVLLALKSRSAVALEKAVAMSDYGNCGATLCSEETAADRVNRLLDAGMPQWFALAIKPRCEKTVARTLQTKGFQTFLPFYNKRHEYGTRHKESELPLFPGYVFCRFNCLTRLPILVTPGVTQILGAGRTPIPLSEIEMDSLQAAIKARLSVQPFPFLPVGEKVRINRGVLKGVEGIVLNYKQDFRLVLSVTLLQRSVLLEIGRDQISLEPVPKPATREYRRACLSANYVHPAHRLQRFTKGCERGRNHESSA